MVGAEDDRPAERHWGAPSYAAARVDADQKFRTSATVCVGASSGSRYAQSSITAAPACLMLEAACRACSGVNPRWSLPVTIKVGTSTCDSSGNVVIRDAMAKRVKEARHVSVTACIDVSGGTSCGVRERQVIHRFRATRCRELRPLPHSVGVIERNDDVPNVYQLTSAELVQLQRIIEAGLLARDARLSGAGFADATEQELRLLEDQGALARQRFIEANLGLVGMVSRQFAARCQLPNAELFQEGCLGLPACQLPTGSCPRTSLGCQLVNHVALVQLDSVDTEPMGACNALAAPSEGVRRSARASGHLLRGIAGFARAQR